MRFRTPCIVKCCVAGAEVLPVNSILRFTPSLRVRFKKLESLCCGMFTVIFAIGFNYSYSTYLSIVFYNAN